LPIPAADGRKADTRVLVLMSEIEFALSDWGRMEIEDSSTLAGQDEDEGD